MPQNLKQKTQKQAEEAKSCIENRKDIEHNRQNVFRSQRKQNNQNCHSFVKFNKRKIFQKLGGKKLKSIKEFGSQGFIYFCLFI